MVVFRGDSASPDSGGAEAVLSVRQDQFARLAAWADPQTLSVGFTGLLARQVRDLAAEVGLTPQNFVLEAVNAFIQAGEMAAGGGHGHAHGGGSEGGPAAPPAGQPIELEGP